MAVVLVLVALAMIGGGVFAIVEGLPILVIERGWTMVIAGAAVAGSGAVLAGVGLAVAGLRRVERALKALGEQVGRLEATARPAIPAVPREASPAPMEPSPQRRQPPAPEITRDPVPDLIAKRSPAEPAVAHRLAEPQPPASLPNGPEPEAAPHAPTVVGTYNSGGNRYVMFSDGSIEAETPNGQFRFNSLDELKVFIAAGGEEAAPAPT